MPAQTSKQRKHRKEQRFALDRNMMMGLEAKAVPAVDFANSRNKSLMNLELITANFYTLENTGKRLVQICTGTYTVNISVPPFQVNHHLVVVDKGNEFYLIASRGAVLTFTAKRLD